VPRNKTDRTDAKGLLEAPRNADLHAVPVKSVDQQCLAALHRLRSTRIGSIPMPRHGARDGTSYGTPASS
jgi:transposase